MHVLVSFLMELNFNLIGTFRLLGRLNDEHLEVKHESLPLAQAIVASSSDDDMQILVAGLEQV